jgi:PAS domain S-box-containing protein
MVSGWSSYRVARASLEKEAFEKLTAVREMKAQQLEDYFLQIQNQAISLSQDPIVVEMARDLPLAVEDLNSGPTPDLQEAEARSERLREHYKRVILPRIGGARTSEPKLDEIFPTEGALRLQDLYIASNRHQTGEKHLLDTAGDGSSYSTLHARVHPTLRDYLERFGYYDIFIIEPTDGRIVYSVFKEIDFGTSLNNGPHRDSNLALAFRSAVAADAASFTKLVDYAPYEPSYDAPAAFIASPIFDGANLVGVLALQLPIDRINDVMTSHRRWSEVGLGSSGETYLVGSDYKLRNQSRFLIEDKDNYLTLISQTGMPEIDVSKIRKFGTSIGLQKVETAGTKAALQGERGTATFLDYRGVPVLSAYKPLEIGGLRWAIMSEIDEAEALAPATDARSLEGGNLDSSIRLERGDEIGDLGRSLESMRVGMQKLIGELRENNETLEQRVEERTEAVQTARERIQAILENASDGVVVHDGEGIITMFNPEAENIFGYRAEEITGRSIDELVPNDVRPGHAAKVQDFASSGTTSRQMGERIEIHGQKKDGSLFPAEVGISVSKTRGEVAMTAFVRDISERKRLEAELRDAFQVIKAQKDRMENELNVARDIQMSMLPLIFPALSSRYMLG